jgi:hypothetical protein
VVVEQHAAARFAWLQKDAANSVAVEPSPANRLTVIAYNLVWWAPIVLGFFKVIDYRTGFIAFFIVTIVRAMANLIRNNLLKPEQALNFPFRAP